MQAPERFTSAVRDALEAELPSLRPAAVRSRFRFRETCPAEELVAMLDRIRAHGSHGVILKAPDLPEIITACSQLIGAGIPVVTLVTDLPGSQRLAYIGMDNRAAGTTAAYLMGQWLGDRPGNILITLSQDFFRGEEEREMGFRGAIRGRYPNRALVEIDNSDGLDETMRGLVLAALESDPEINAVYSIGGGNMAIVEASPQPAGPTRSSSPMTSTTTTPDCSAAAGYQPCCTTTSIRTCARPVTPSCRHTTHSPEPGTPGPRTSTSLRRTTCPRRGFPSAESPLFKRSEPWPALAPMLA
jgi:ABC-type sugar transport system substrate-binding protein